MFTKMCKEISTRQGSNVGLVNGQSGPTIRPGQEIQNKSCC